MNRVAPEFGEWCFAKRGVLVPAQHRGNLGLAAGHEHHVSGLFVESETNRVIGGRIAGVQRGDDVNVRRQFGRGDRFLDRQVEKRHARKTESAGEFS